MSAEHSPRESTCRYTRRLHTAVTRRLRGARRGSRPAVTLGGYTRRLHTAVTRGGYTRRLHGGYVALAEGVDTLPSCHPATLPPCHPATLLPTLYGERHSPPCTACVEKSSSELSILKALRLAAFFGPLALHVSCMSMAAITALVVSCLKISYLAVTHMAVTHGGYTRRLHMAVLEDLVPGGYTHGGYAWRLHMAVTHGGA